MMENSNAFYNYTTSSIFILILSSCYINFSSNLFPQVLDIKLKISIPKLYQELGEYSNRLRARRPGFDYRYFTLLHSTSQRLSSGYRGAVSKDKGARA
jgi:hypothetical protein